MSGNIGPHYGEGGFPELDKPFAITCFRNFAAASRIEASSTLLRLADRIRSTTAREKNALPWLKLARFGDRRSEKGSLRHDANVLVVTGIEADYDGEVVPVDQAVEMLLKAGILSLVYTSPSHTEAAPRWRVLCPFTHELPPQRRNHQLGRLNGLFRGIFSGESWTLSQAYYFGSVGRNPAHRVELIEGTPIDGHDELDQLWMGKPGSVNVPDSSEPHAGQETREDAELVRCIVTGEHLHVELCALAARYVGRNIPAATVEELLRGIMLSHPEGARDERWFDRYYSIPELVASAVRKYRSDAVERRRPIAALACSLIRKRRPGDEVRAAVLAEAEACSMQASEAERIVQWAARQELARRGEA